MQFADNEYRSILVLYALTPAEMTQRELEERRIEVEEKKREREEKEQHYLSVLSRIDSVKSRGIPEECGALVSELEQLGNYKDSQLILHKLCTLNKNTNLLGLVHCPICNTSQAPDKIVCYRCGITFFRD
jgi:hypothetical protein